MKLVRKLISLFMLVLILAPALVQLSHIVLEEHHDTEVCLSKDEKHYHDYEIDCELCDFHLNNFSVVSISKLPSIELAEINSPETFFYSFKSESVTSFNLRGPPSLA
jgi:hypothetical protein